MHKTPLCFAPLWSYCWHNAFLPQACNHAIYLMESAFPMSRTMQNTCGHGSRKIEIESLDHKSARAKSSKYKST